MAKKSSLKKRILSSAPVHFLGSLIFSLLMRGMFLTGRVTRDFPESMQPYARGELPAIFCFWHGRMLMHPFVRPGNRSMSVLISHHNDGALITATMRWLGIGSVRIHSRRNNAKTVRELLAVTERGGNIGITPDGPRGPFQQAAGGAAYVASKTGYPMIPVTFSARRHWRLRSWDQFLIPKFFTQIHFVAGDPIHVIRDTEDDVRDALTTQLATELTRITLAADITCGVAQ
jgi:lysophospholipid acyltransferase (LPLAT)-like uncharacterized protein